MAVAVKGVARSRHRPRGRALSNSAHGHVIDCRYVVHSLKPMALLKLVYRDPLLLRETYRRTFERMPEGRPERACRRIVELLPTRQSRWPKTSHQACHQPCQ